ncbi:COG3904 family protein [Ancylobacter terrae]|uniref:COG3904 family protein n=1 Tax=Ancylobacter sp. sgz301288 TaxID=3342077 RepID=UPI00385CE186
MDAETVRYVVHAAFGAVALVWLIVKGPKNIEENSGAAPKRPWNILSNHWNGLYTLGISYWVFGFLVSAASPLGVDALMSALNVAEEGQPVLIFVGILLGWIFISALTIWQCVGIWRSADRLTQQRKAQSRTARWAVVAKFMVVVGLLQSVALFVRSGAPMLKETYDMAFRGDPDLPAYTMRLMREGTEAEIIGGFKYGIAADFERLLAESPQLEVVHLDSIGGRLGEAVKVNRIIRNAKLKTYVSNVCASACTVAFAGGVERWMSDDGVLAFHGSAFPGVSSQDLREADRRQHDVMVSSGFDAAFVTKALAIPNEDMWQPTASELLAAHVITGVADGTRFAISGFGETSKAGFADAVGDGVPILRALKAKDPTAFDLIIDEYYTGYLEGKTEDENANILRYASYAAVVDHLPGADDEAVVAWGALLAEELTRLKERDPVDCAIFGLQGGGDFELQYSFDSDTLAKYQEVGSRIVQTSTERRAEEPGRISELSRQVREGLKGIVSDEQVATLVADRLTEEQAPNYCTAVIGFVEAALKAPAGDAAVILRSLLKPG